MTITVSADGQDPARPPANGAGLEASLRILSDRAKPGLRALLAGSDSGQPSWGHVFLREDLLASFARLFDLLPVQGGPGEPIPIHLEVEDDALRFAFAGVALVVLAGAVIWSSRKSEGMLAANPAHIHSPVSGA